MGGLLWFTIYIAEPRAFLNSLSLKLSRAEQSLCEGELTEGECKRALDAMATGKSPGLDGLPAEFYQRFWSLLGTDFVDVINFAYNHGQLSPSQRSGVITLIHKRGDRLDMKNWRPITLLCADYKIVAKAIANLLLGVIAKVTHSDQTCGVPGRNSLESVRLLKDVVFHANQNRKAAAIISLDQEKAFDRVEWGYLSRVLQTMNFGQSFQKWVFLLYSNIFSCILINGETTEFFSVSRGVRQGCPLSPLLYVLVAETIASAIRADRFIDSYILPNGRSVKLCQYADDTSVIVTTDLALNALFHIFTRYEKASGAKLNATKCHGLLIGTWQSRSNLPIALDWSNVEIIVLGSRISNDNEEQWESKIKALKTTLRAWNRRALSFRGRALISNMLGLSTLWYLCSFSVIPEAIIKAVNGEVFPFVWRKKREWMARTSVTQRPNQGGLGVVDVYRKMLSLHVLWVKRLIFRPNLPWTSFVSQFLKRAFPGRSVHQILILAVPPKYAMDALPPFYRSVMTAWFALERKFVDNEYVICGPQKSVVTLEQLWASFVYDTLSHQHRKQHRCVEKYANWGLPVDWSNVWLSLLLWRFIRPVRDTSWLIAHGILPTADRLLRFGVQVDPLCHCGRTESLVHLFTDCSFAIQLIDWYFSVYKRFRPQSQRPSKCDLLVGYGKNVKVPPVFPCLLGIIRHHIWLTRNKARFDKVIPHYPTVLSRVKSALRCVIRLQQRHCLPANFSDFWLASGCVGSLSAGDIIVFAAEFRD